MAFCTNCGAQVQGKFCPNCGTAFAQSPGQAIPQAAAPVAAGMTENVASALCYILGLITGILFLVLAPYNQNRNIRFHAFQSIFGHIAWIASWIVLQVISLSFRTIPVLGVLISFALWLCLFFGGLCVWLYVMYKAYNNERVVLPVIGPMAEKQANS